MKHVRCNVPRPLTKSWRAGIKGWACGQGRLVPGPLDWKNTSGG